VPGVLKNITYEDPVVKYRGEKVISIFKKLERGRVNIDMDLATDIYYVFYLPFPALRNPNEISAERSWHYTIIKEMLKSPDIAKTRVYTVANSHSSTVIAVSFIQHLMRELSSTEGLEGESEERGREDVKQMLQDISSEDLGKAVQKAAEMVAEESKVVSKLEKLSMGKLAGRGSYLDFERSSEEVLKLARSIDVRKLLQLLEKLPRLGAETKKRKEEFVKGELDGYELSSNVEKLVPTELAYPDLYLYAKFAEGRLLSYKKVLPMSIGPLYVLLDKSGSMEGTKILWAKATALALFMRARAEKRPFYIRFFDSTPYSLVKVSMKTKPSEILRLMEYIARVKSGGGTDITRAVISACDDIEGYRAKGASDIVLVTDGEDRVSDAIIKRMLKRASAKLVTVMIRGDNSDLRRLSSKYFRVIQLSSKEILQVVEF